MCYLSLFLLVCYLFIFVGVLSVSLFLLVCYLFVFVSVLSVSLFLLVFYLLLYVSLLLFVSGCEGAAQPAANKRSDIRTHAGRTAGAV